MDPIPDEIKDIVPDQKGKSGIESIRIEIGVRLQKLDLDSRHRILILREYERKLFLKGGNNV